MMTFLVKTQKRSQSLITFYYEQKSSFLLKIDLIKLGIRHDINMLIEPVCCKEQQKKSSLPVTGLWNRGPLKILNGIKMILNDHLDSYIYICNQFGITQVLQRSPIPKTSNWSGTFFAVSYSKPALGNCYDVCHCVFCNFATFYNLQFFTWIVRFKRQFFPLCICHMSKLGTESPCITGLLVPEKNLHYPKSAFAKYLANAFLG